MQGRGSDAGVRYSERLWPTPGVWAAAIGLTLGFGLVWLPLGEVLALAMGIVATSIVAGLLAWTTPRVEVREELFVAGRARLPLALVGAVEPLEGEDMRLARGPRLDARAHLCLRGWLPGGVRVHLTDPHDPAPYWIVSSRRPRELAAALAAARHPAS